MDYQHICEQVSVLARNVGVELMHYRTNNQLIIEVKGSHDFVTQMDKFSERKLVDGLEQIVPEAGFIAEENTRTNRSEKYNWVVDPIDGTTNFIHSMPPYAISIALMEEEKIVVGVVLELSHMELFSAWIGGGAYLNGKPIHVSAAPDVNSSLVATGFPYSNFDRMDEYMLSLSHFMRYSSGVRRIGSAATDLVYTACGRFDAFYEYDLKPYDVAAGAIIVTEAGGKVCDFAGGSNFIFGREIVATNALIHNEFMQTIIESFGK